MHDRHHVLIVDDEEDLRWVLRGLFEDEGFQVSDAADGEAALAALTAGDHLPDVVLSDMRMPGMTGNELLMRIRHGHPDLPVVLLSAVEDLATAVDAIKDGAFDYQAKPFDPARLMLSVRRAAEQHALRREVRQLRAGQVGASLDFGPSPAAQTLRQTLDLLARQPTVSVLITGPSGTGKEVAARAIHALSATAAGPFVAIDCGALPEPLLESQLFGHERGAFTGADRARQGLFAMADGGTLFLDELGNLPLTLQAKLLRALQERAVVPVGGSTPQPFRARLLAASNVDLPQAVAAGQFRLDLYHRIAEFEVALPALRERPEDTIHFARRFLGEANAELGRQVERFTEAAEHALQRHPWPGNLRQLRNAVRRTVLLATSREIDAADLDLHEEFVGAASDRLRPSPPGGPQPLGERLDQARHSLEGEILRTTLAACAGNKAAAARALHIDYTTLHRKLKRHGIG